MLNKIIKKFKVPIAKILLFLILFLVLCCFVNFMCQPRLVDTRIIQGFYAEKDNSLDVVYIGGSAAFVYYEPLMAYEDYGISSYVLGANTIQPEVYKLLVSEVLKKQNPKLIVIDARAFQYRDFDQPPTEVAYRNILTGLPLSIEKHKFIQKYVKDVLNDDDLLSYYFSFIPFHTGSSDGHYTWVDAIRMFAGKYNHEYKGFYFVPKVVKEKFVSYEVDLEMAMFDDTVKIFNDLLDYLKEQKVNVLFVVSPYIEQVSHKAVFNYIDRRVSEYGFDFVDANDFRKQMGINYDTDFYNENHVNIFGADKYTKFICEYIKENYDLPDIRGDSSWEELLDNWHNEKNKTKRTIEDLIEKLEE